jgi:hypothetical protein
MQQLYGSIVANNKKNHSISFSDISQAAATAASFNKKKKLVASGNN